MKNGFRVFDSDTHVNPAAEVLERYVDPGFRPRLAELAQYRSPVSREAGSLHNYRVATKYYRRILGEAAPRETFTAANPMARRQDAAAGSAGRPGREPCRGHGRQGDRRSFPDPRLVDEPSRPARPLVRSRDGPRLSPSRADFCAPFPDRLKGLIVASGRNVEEAVREIREWGNSKWAVAVKPMLHMDIPPDHPDLEPIWQAAEDHGLPIAHHSSTWNPPYYPGYRDVWDNIFLGRLASHPWGAMRFVAAFIGGGILDRYPGLRLAVLECGFGWLPFWARRMDEQAVYVGGVAPLKHRPSEYIAGGRFFCSIEHQEGEDMFNHVTHFLGDDVLMYASDYPHSECQFPNSIDNILAWQSLQPDTRKKLLWDNAARFFKQT